jgi:hypothetical protein
MRREQQVLAQESPQSVRRTRSQVRKVYKFQCFIRRDSSTNGTESFLCDYRAVVNLLKQGS